MPITSFRIGASRHTTLAAVDIAGHASITALALVARIAGASSFPGGINTTLPIARTIKVYQSTIGQAGAILIAILVAAGAIAAICPRIARIANTNRLTGLRNSA